MNIIVLDTESDGLAYECTKLHVLSWTEGGVYCEYCGGSGKIDVSGGWGADDCPPLPEWESCDECMGSGQKYKSTADYDQMRAVVESADLLVAHNSIRHDLVVFNRILGIPMDYRKWVDTLALSWYLYPERSKHGLANWGQDLGVAKPKVDDWQNLSFEEYAHRCQEDVKINWMLWKKMERRLEEIYG